AQEVAGRPGGRAMTGAELLEKIAAQRKERCQRILADPSTAVICEGCSSLLWAKDLVLCPFCKTYRFDADLGRILEMARLLGERPIAFGCAVLPRNTGPTGLSHA